MHTKDTSLKNVVLAEVLPDVREKAYFDQRMQELEQLVDTHGGMNIIHTFQQRIKPDYTSYLGKGKVEEVIEYMKEHDAKILIIGNILKPRQVFHLSEQLRKYDMQVWDRIDLILKIFGQHAQSTEAELQIELAAIKHMGPRIFDMSMELGRQGAGGGGGGGGAANRGSGETNTEIMKRHLQTRREQIAKDLKKYEKVRKVHRESRKKNYLPTIGLVGYTNAGKSSLTNMLTGKGVYVADALFATLGTNVGKLYIPSMTGKGTELLINDTIGFIRDLPPSLIDAFKSTLEDSIHADLLLHVVDANDPMVSDKIQVVDEILDQIGAEQERVLVYNKVDRLVESQESGNKKQEEKQNEGTAPQQVTGGKKEEVQNLQDSRHAGLAPVSREIGSTSNSHLDTIRIQKQKLLDIAKEHKYDEVYFASAMSEEGKEDLIQMIVEKTKRK